MASTLMKSSAAVTTFVSEGSSGAVVFDSENDDCLVLSEVEVFCFSSSDCLGGTIVNTSITSMPPKS